MCVIVHKAESKTLKRITVRILFNQGQITQKILFGCENILTIIAPDANLEVGIG